ncbi:MAG: prolipoprotein diacylglyceryl transferase, partial [Actinomycetota bacterium]
MLAAIPSPHTGIYHVGPLTLHMYGVMLLVAIAACIWLTGRRWVAWGGDWDLVYRVAVWGVIAGIVGARIYHLITSWNQDPAIHDHWYGPFAVWEGGLGIWGAIPFGVGMGALIVRRSGNSVRLMMDAVAPGLLLAQAIGRWGNYFNQELFGKPTTLPWALEIAPQHRPAGYLQYATFQPTFLYESLACLAIFGILLLVEHRARLKFGQTFALYVALYTFARFFFENMR